MVCPQGDSFEDATDVVRELNKIVNNYWRGPWISYSSAPKEVKDLWWNEFKAHDLGTETTYAATFERVFQKKDKTWVGDRAKSVKEKYDELLMSAASGDDGGDASSQAADNMAMWVEASGGVKRGKIYGWGNLSRELVAKDDGSSSSNAAASRRRRIDEETAQQVSRLTLLLAEKDEQMKRQEERLSQKDDQIRYLQAQMAMVLQTST
ncbi:uncharacterized protein LOC115733800 isoform X2 [Rhodamnia argentea]|uniref:Uncharacterized protein LOC115733800 isoform X2 n=1 Tax=Rhodamnia argentea TaxID=178133 RepID=A0ABM3H858_9MYRT|nr:uncharacterized protein LOC115733800 isoform X2 [Rhodamnia argentea]